LEFRPASFGLEAGFFVEEKLMEIKQLSYQFEFLYSKGIAHRD
jgi:hypothetical protein